MLLPPLLWFLSLLGDEPLKPPLHGLHVLWSIATPSCPLMHCPWSPSCYCVCAKKNGKNISPLPMRWSLFLFFIIGLVPCPLCLLMLHLCSLSCCSIVQKGAARNFSPRHRQSSSSFFQVSNEHPFLLSPCFFLLFTFLCIGHVPFLVVMFVQGGTKRNEEEHCPHPPPLLGFIFWNENKTQNMKMKHET